MIRLARPLLEAEETAAVARVLASGMLVQGAEVAAFERSIAEYLEQLAPGRGAIHAVAVSSGTAALELALMDVEAHAPDEVIVPALTWPSPGNAVILRGATPVLVDVDAHTWNLDPRRVAVALTAHTRAIIAIDQFGVASDVPALRRVANGLPFVEDAACALGSSLDGVPCGLLGDVGTLSFHPRKVITTGEGGMLLTRDARRAGAFAALRNHGQETPGVFRDAGPNARMSEMQAAIGGVQMTRLERILVRRRALAEYVRSELALHWQGAPDGAVVNHQTLGFVLPTPSRGSLREARDALVASLRNEGVEAGALSLALHRLPQFARVPCNTGRVFPIADAIADGGIALPLHPAMTDEDAATVVRAVRTHATWALGRRAFTS